MFLAFFLSMPNVGSWNGKWTGEGKCHVVIEKHTSKTAVAKYKPLAGKNYRYDFGDGWSMNIEVKEVTAIEAKRLKKQSAGFCGYDWAIDSIMERGYITTKHDLERQKETELKLVDGLL